MFRFPDYLHTVYIVKKKYNLLTDDSDESKVATVDILVLVPAKIISIITYVVCLTSNPLIKNN